MRRRFGHLADAHVTQILHPADRAILSATFNELRKFRRYTLVEVENLGFSVEVGACAKCDCRDSSLSACCSNPNCTNLGATASGSSFSLNIICSMLRDISNSCRATPTAASQYECPTSKRIDFKTLNALLDSPIWKSSYDPAGSIATKHFLADSITPSSVLNA